MFSRRRTALVVGGRELALGQSIAAVVHDDVDHVQPPPNGMRELAETNRGCIPIARNADVDEVAIGEVGPRRHGRHSPVDAVEAVAAAQKVCRRFRGAAYAGDLGDPVRREVELETSLDYGRGDGVVAAAGAQGRHRPFVIAPRQAESVAFERGVIGAGFLNVGHLASLTRQQS